MQMFGTPLNFFLLLGAFILLLFASWAALAVVSTQSGTNTRAIRLALVLGAGLMPVVAMLAAGPVWGIYGGLWPTLVLTPVALIWAIMRTRT